MARDVPDVASWNPYAGNSAANMKKGLDALMVTGADVIGMQEMSDDGRWDTVRDHMKAAGWWTTPTSNAIPIHVNTKTYEVTSWKSVTYNNDKPTVENGAGGNRAPVKSIMRVSLKHREQGTVSHHFNLHIIATIEQDNRVGGGYNPKRLKFAQGHIDLLLKLAKPYIDSGEPVTASADWNVSSSTDAGKWLREQMAKAGFKSAQHELGPFNTHGVREIDDVYYANTDATKMRRLDAFGSDHCPIEVDLGPKDTAPDGAEEETPMAKSQNGYTAASTTSGIPGGTKRIKPKGAEQVGFTVKAGDVATVLQYLIDQFHARVEDIGLYTKGDDWGFASRPIRGQSSGLSNHASGTAIDINATRHPLGVATSRNFSAKQIATIHTIINSELDGAVRWGGDYSGRKDAMHFEINVSAAKLKKIAARILSGDIHPPTVTPPKPPEPAKPKPLISLKAVQEAIKTGSPLPLGVDGEQYQTMLNRFGHGYTLEDIDGILRDKTRRSTAIAQMTLAQRNGNKDVDKTDCWPDKGYLPDFDGVPGPQLFKALGIDNTDEK